MIEMKCIHMQQNLQMNIDKIINYTTKKLQICMTMGVTCEICMIQTIKQKRNTNK